MKLADIVNGPWAITPEMLTEIRGIYEVHLRGEKIDIPKVEARLGRPLENKQRRYVNVNGVAVVALEGVLAKRMNLMMQVSGGASTQIIGSDLDMAARDPSVKAILLDIDSPGGTIDGTQELAYKVASIGATKPVVAYANGAMLSAAYWVGAAADAIYIASDTTLVGSIGVVATHVDTSQAEAQRGIKTTEIVAGKYKRIATQHAPLSEEGRASIQDQVDQIYETFVDDVARFRGASTDEVLQNMADGRVFMGSKAKQAGLVDGVSTMEGLIQLLAGGNYQPRRRKLSSAGVAHPQPAVKGETPVMTLETLQAEYPQIAEALRAQGFDEGRKAGAQAELDRIKSVRAKQMAGHEALIETLMFDGKTTGAEAAEQILAAEQNLRQKHLADMQSAAPKPAPSAASTAIEQPSGTAASGYKTPVGYAGAQVSQDRLDLHNRATAYAKQHKVGYTDAVLAVQKGE